MVRRTSALAVAILCVLAGCNAFGGQEAAAVEETVTPAPVPTVPTEIAPGISARSVNASTVAANHRRALYDSSYTSRTRIQWQYENGTRYNATTVQRVEAGGRWSHVVAEYGHPRGTDGQTGHELWYDGNRTLLRIETVDGDERFRRVDTFVVDQDPQTRLIRALFVRFEPIAVNQSANGDLLVSGRLEDVGGLRVFPRFRNESNATMSVRISPEGYVTRLAVGFDADVEGRPVDTRMSVEFTNVGSTTVSKPRWVENLSEGPETPGISEGRSTDSWGIRVVDH